MATTVKEFGEQSNRIDRMGRTVVHEGELLRHTVYTRFLHWMVGIFFFRRYSRSSKERALSFSKKQLGC